MATIRIMLAPIEMQQRLAFGSVFVDQVKQSLADYTKLPSFWVKGYDKEAAEEVFDLTNNPGREEERQLKYGNGRSLSSGDIVELDNKMFLCMANGWAELAK